MQGCERRDGETVPDLAAFHGIGDLHVDAIGRRRIGALVRDGAGEDHPAIGFGAVERCKLFEQGLGADQGGEAVLLQDRAVAMMRNGVVDFAVTTQAADYPELQFEEFGADPFYLVCKRNHPLARQKSVTWRETVDYPFIALSATTSVRRFADIAMGQSDLLIRPRYEVEQIPSAVALVAAGLGITALPSLTLAMFSHRALAMRPLVAPVVQRRLGVLTLKERTPSAPARFLLERVSKTLAAAAMKTPAA